ncbi:unnamed protein product [Microthlaspi erraticum]|uniref:FKB95-like N-terminal Kelch domain-containing protein n=1 Tax=Microthlaspi erraticum TaxID=1685480 RepID=A0A6D2I7D2_9BRAS|nr:unnamed protein product [Microthlaspi erraticum]
MKAVQDSVSACVLDKKIYTFGVNFDSDAQTFENSFEIYAVCNFDAAAVAYNPEERRWDNKVDREIGRTIVDLNSQYVIGNVLYTVADLERKGDPSEREIMWYDTAVGRWREVTGLKGAIQNFHHPCPSFRLADYGGKLALFWEVNWSLVSKIDFYRPTKKVWGAVVALERRQSDGEISGKVEWCDGLLPIPIPSRLLKVVAVTV